MPVLTMSSPSEIAASGSLRCSQQITDAHVRHPAITDLLIVSSDPKVHSHIEGLFRRFGWSVASRYTCSAAIDFATDNLAAVALCEEELPDGTWRDVAGSFNAQPYSPSLIVIAEGKSVLSKVAENGGFDVLTEPFNRADVLWAVASAWHTWMTAYEKLAELSSRMEDVAS